MSEETVSAYVFEEKGTKLVKKDVPQVPLKANMVEVEITVVSLCHTDLSLGLNDWGNSQYPLVGGHEAVGRVTKLGAETSGTLKVGDRVCVGWMRSSCGSCLRCSEGEESMCWTRGGAGGVSLIFTGLLFVADANDFFFFFVEFLFRIFFFWSHAVSFFSSLLLFFLS